MALSESGRPNGRSEDEESAYPGHETSGVRQKITTREQRFTIQHGSGLLFQKTAPGSLDQDTGRGFLGRSSQSVASQITVGNKLRLNSSVLPIG